MEQLCEARVTKGHLTLDSVSPLVTWGRWTKISYKIHSSTLLVLAPWFMPCLTVFALVHLWPSFIHVPIHLTFPYWVLCWARDSVSEEGRHGPGSLQLGRGDSFPLIIEFRLWSVFGNKCHGREPDPIGGIGGGFLRQQHLGRVIHQHLWGFVGKNWHGFLEK